ncbi:MAG: hypothetical protein ACJA0Q_001518, partial [Saprospiraceae bacterium]
MSNYLLIFNNAIFKPNLRLFVVLLVCFLTNVAHADHYYGGYFYYETIDDKTVQVSLITYTDFHNDDSDRDSVSFEWGDSKSSFLIRVNNSELGEEVYEGMKKNVYVGTHEYFGYANYQLYFSDNYRLFDVKNMGLGKSGVTNLRFDAIAPVQDSMIYCINDSPLPLLDPYFYGKQGQEFQLNFGYYDVQGDSMTFALVDCKGGNGDAAEGYTIPGDATIDINTGQFKWDSPKKGKYCFSFEVAEYRNGELLGNSSTDFTLFISHSDYFSFDKGVFSDVSGSTNRLYGYSNASTQSFTASYSHPQADSIHCTVLSPFNEYSAFVLSRKNRSTSTSFSDTVDLQYLGGGNYNGYEPLVWEFTAFLGKDSVLKEVLAVGVAVYEFIDWDCEVPDLSDIHELVPKIPTFTISPNLFSNDVWINVGTTYENITMNIFDLRGRMVRSYYNLMG